MDGKLVKRYSEINQDVLEVDLKSMSSGIYHLKLITANGIYNRKVIKQ